MVIKLSQPSHLKLYEYEIEIDGSCKYGNIRRQSIYDKILYRNGDTEIIGTFGISELSRSIPFGYLFGAEERSKCYTVRKNGLPIGTVYYSRHGFRKSCYFIDLGSEVLQCYGVSKGIWDYACIYIGDRQIALMETYLTIVDNRYKHKLYLLDEFDRFSDVLAWFALYYSENKFTRDYGMICGTSTYRYYSFSKYKGKYDPAWRESYFPKENFFGKFLL